MRTLPLLLFPFLLIACQPAGEPDPGVDVPPPEEVVGSADALLGTWVLTRQSGSAPEQVYTVTFTTTGDYITLREGLPAERLQFHPADENTISITDSLGAEVALYDYDVSGDALTLTDPATGAEAEFERREDLLEEREELTPRDTVDPEPAQPAPVQAPPPTR